MTDAPERIWAWTYDDCSSDNEDEWRLSVPIWSARDPFPIDAPEYIHADLAYPDARELVGRLVVALTMAHVWLDYEGKYDLLGIDAALTAARAWLQKEGAK